jgi:hypothetical protein
MLSTWALYGLNTSFGGESVQSFGRHGDRVPSQGFAPLGITTSGVLEVIVWDADEGGDPRCGAAQPSGSTQAPT